MALRKGNMQATGCGVKRRETLSGRAAGGRLLTREGSDSEWVVVVPVM